VLHNIVRSQYLPIYRNGRVGARPPGRTLPGQRQPGHARSISTLRMEPIMTKQCKACGNDFHPHPKVPDQSYCASPRCQRERRRRWQQAKRRQDSDYRDNTMGSSSRARLNAVSPAPTFGANRHCIAPGMIVGRQKLRAVWLEVHAREITGEVSSLMTTDSGS
jgi:ribosomal protein L37E